jgi:hypothetical protein
MNKKSASKSAFFNPRIFAACLLVTIGVSLGVISFAAPTSPKRGPAQAGSSSLQPVVINSTYNGVSPRLRDLPVTITMPNGTYESHAPLPIRPPHAPPQLPVVDPVQQTTMPAIAMPAPLQTFEGMNQADGCGNCIPPDPDGAVGPNHYVEMVNSSYSVYDKSGTRLVGPVHINQLWSNLPGRCQVDNDGDPIVVYDNLADRWVLSQFAVNGGNGPFAQCIAVSTTADPTGTYNVYEFDQTTFNDYPKLGVWPDAYYMTTNQFGGTGGTFSGAGAYAFERAAMLTGQPARVVFFDLSTVNSNFGNMLPSHLDGQPPAVGSPNYFAEVDSQIDSPTLGADAMRIWKFHVDWTNPSNSTFGLSGNPNFTVPVPMWTAGQCIEGQGTCVPQEASPYQLDSLGDHLMFRLVYRNFGDHEALLINHSVIADVRLGIRWYEVRNLSTTPTIFQSGTFAPVDTLWRWMGSIAFDHFGDIAVGYSTSSANSFPSIAYAGRLAGDPLGQLSQGETQLWAGLGPENVGFFAPPVGRWGDYTDLTVDPTDGCTFWYVNEYFASITDQGTNLPGAPWQTRIGSFKFPTCVASPVQIAGVASRKTHGNAGTFDVDLPLSGPRGVEPRSGGTNGNFTIVFTFQNPLTNVADAKVTSGAGTVSSSAVGNDPHQYIVNLTGVTNAQYITISLTNVYDSAGNSSSIISVPMGVLLGDVDASGRVDSTDVFDARQNTLQITTSSNFRADIDESGRIDSSDVFIARQQALTSLPSSP